MSLLTTRRSRRRVVDGTEVVGGGSDIVEAATAGATACTSRRADLDGMGAVADVAHIDRSLLELTR